MICKLPPRLKTIADFIDKDAAVADIGTDHGLLPAYLAQNSLARRVIASDISAGSLDSARRAAVKYGVPDKVTFIVADGLAGCEEAGIDTAVAAGMGGETIAGILSKAPWTRTQGVKLILQPQSKTGELCRWLRTNGYVINDAELTRDSGRLYIVFVAGGEVREESEAHTGGRPAVEGKTPGDNPEPEMELMMLLKKKGDPLFHEYLDDKIKRTHNAVAGTEKSENADNTSLVKKLDRLKKLRI